MRLDCLLVQPDPNDLCEHQDGCDEPATVWVVGKSIDHGFCAEHAPKEEDHATLPA